MRKARWLFRKLRDGLVDFVRTSPLDPFPIRNKFAGHTWADTRADIRAGINVALLAFPQGMAYAVIAELPIKYGIVSGAVSALVAPLFSGSRHTILGPTNATAFMIFSSFAAFNLAQREAWLPLLVLFVGILLVLGALFRVADLIQYISRSVVVGYITGAAILIIANQTRHILGIEIGNTASDTGPPTFFTIILGLADHVKDTQWQPLVLGIITFAVWGLMSLRFKKLPVFAITLVAMSGVYALLHHQFGWVVKTFDPFSISDLKPQLPTISNRGLFYDISQLIGIAFSVAFLAALENSVMSKTLASRSGDRPEMNQDMLSVGLANLTNAFAGGMPASGSLTRSALNFSSGAASRLSSIFSGILCVIGALTLGPYMAEVPKCVLAVLVVCIAGSVISRRQIRISLYSTPGDALVLITTLVSTLIMPLNVAIFLGVGVSIMIYLRTASKPYLTEYEFDEGGELREAGEKRERPTPAISIVHVEGDLFFGAAELFRTQIQKLALDDDLKIVILRLKNSRYLDATSVIALEDLIQFVRTHDRDIIVSGASKNVYRVLKNSGIIETVGRKNVFLNSPKNPNLSTRYALLRAQELLGTKEAEVRIFYDPTKDKK